MTGNSTDGLQAVLFGASGSAYGADIRDVREIMKLSNITAIPGASTHTEGVIDVRGEVVPLLSLRSLTGAPHCEHDKETRVLILDCRPPIGLIVDTVSEVKSIPSAAIEPMPQIATGAGRDSFYRGIAKLSDRMIIIMDLKKISTIAGGKTAECEQTAVVAPAGAATIGPADNAMISSDSSLELTEFRIDALRELGNIGTSHAATSLSQLVGRDIQITVPAISVEHIGNIPAMVSNDRAVGLLLNIRDGDRNMGYLYTMFSERSAANIVDTLMGQPMGTTSSIGEVEQSAIMEVGNILASSFCDAMAGLLDTVILPSPPSFVYDMVSAIIQSSLIEIGMIADDAIVFRTDLSDEQRSFDGYVILFPNPEMLGHMLSILDAKVNP